jgi:tetratricopeptide (TPR) repeat protein
LSNALRLVLPPLAVLLAAAACGSLIGPPYQAPPAPQTVGPGANAAQPNAAPSAGPQPQQSQPAPQPPEPAPPPAPSPRQYRLGAAATALVEQARKDAASGDPQLAQGTLERALRIEPENPLLWTLLGEAHESAGQYALAGSMGHKALQLATGDPRAQAQAWRLIGDSLRARGRNAEANEAYSRADALAAP